MNEKEFSGKTEEEQTFNMDFGQLITKHPIRWEIWAVLVFYTELNINQISKFVKQSRFTVSRHLKAMEADGMLLSREVQPIKRGKYAPKYYKINPLISGPTPQDADKIDEYMEQFFEFYQVPKDIKERLELYKSVLRECRYMILSYGKTLESFNFLFDRFEELLPDSSSSALEENQIQEADIFFKKYIGGINEPFFVGMTFDKEHFRQFREIHKEYWKKLFLLNIDQKMHPDLTGRYYGLMTIVFPNRAVLDLKRRKFTM